MCEKCEKMRADYKPNRPPQRQGDGGRRVEFQSFDGTPMLLVLDEIAELCDGALSEDAPYTSIRCGVSESGRLDTNVPYAVVKQALGSDFLAACVEFPTADGMVCIRKSSVSVVRPNPHAPSERSDIGFPSGQGRIVSASYDEVRRALGLEASELPLPEPQPRRQPGDKLRELAERLDQAPGKVGVRIAGLDSLAALLADKDDDDSGD